MSGSEIERYDLLLARETLYNLQGERQAQNRDLMILRELTEALNNDQRRAEVALRWARYAEVIGDHSSAIVAAQETINLAQKIQDMSCGAAGYRVWGGVLLLQGDFEAGRIQLEQSLELARAAGVHRREADSLRNLSMASRSYAVRP